VILVDTNILSTFARVGELELLFELFKRSKLALTPTVREELNVAVVHGCAWLEQVTRLLDQGRLEMVVAAPDEIQARMALPTSLGAGEAQSIAICQARDWPFLTNDKRARNYCIEAGLEVFDLPDLLRALWEWRIRSPQFVQDLCTRMEAAEDMTIPNKKAIFRT
jgi:predicted nucleic acid-binding protein